MTEGQRGTVGQRVEVEMEGGRRQRDDGREDGAERTGEKILRS